MTLTGAALPVHSEHVIPAHAVPLSPGAFSHLPRGITANCQERLILPILLFGKDFLCGSTFSFSPTWYLHEACREIILLSLGSLKPQYT